MEEKILVGKKNGMLVMLLEILLMVASIAGIIFGAIILENGGNFRIEDDSEIAPFFGLYIFKFRGSYQERSFL